MPLAENARVGIRRVLELVQLDRPEAARTIAATMRCLANTAQLAGDATTRELALRIVAAADRWHSRENVEEARVRVLRDAVAIAKALAITVRDPTTAVVARGASWPGADPDPSG